MPTFLNLPVADLERSKAFYSALGWTIEPNFTDDNAACIVQNEHSYLMLLKHDFYSTFIGTKSIGDAHTTSLALYAFSLDSREEVDAFLARADAAGAKLGPTKDYGFMYQGQFDDPDGHHFEPFWMDPAAAESGPPQE